MNIRDRQILQIALPSIVSNITVPLLGMIDVAIVGHMGSPVYIGAVAVGSMIFNLVYWLFGFLRMGSSGMTSQALGRKDLTEVTRILVRSVVIALGIALLLVVLQMPMKWAAFALIGPTEDVAPFASTYFNIVIWGAPASLALFSLMGWFIGMQNTRFPMFISIMQNVVNILASLTLVYGFGMKIEGVALGTVIAQYAGFIVAIALLLKYYGRLFPYYRGERLFKDISAFFHVNSDIFLRTLCLVTVNLYFTSAGARSGAVILSVNTVMMQLYLFFSYFMDGFAYAGEALGGRTYGAKNKTAFSETLRRLWMWMLIVTTVYTLLYIIGGRWIFSILTDEPPGDCCIRRVSLVDLARASSRKRGFYLGWHIHRHHSHSWHAGIIVHLSPLFLWFVSAHGTPLGQSRTMARHDRLPCHEGCIADHLVQIKNN